MENIYIATLTLKWILEHELWSLRSNNKLNIHASLHFINNENKKIIFTDIDITQGKISIILTYVMCGVLPCEWTSSYYEGVYILSKQRSQISNYSAFQSGALGWDCCLLRKILPDGYVMKCKTQITVIWHTSLS